MKKLLHAADPTIGRAGLLLLAALWWAVDADQHLLILGHHDGIAAAEQAGIPRERILWHRSLGGYDPATYCGIAKAVKAIEPHAVGLWGNWAQRVGCVAARRVPMCIEFIPPSQPYMASAFYTQWFISGRRAAVGFDRGEALICGSTPLRYCVQGWHYIKPPQNADPQDTRGPTATDTAEAEATSARQITFADSTREEGHNAESKQAIKSSGPCILIVAGTGSALRVDIALWAAAIAAQIDPCVTIRLQLPAGRWGVDAERRKRIMEFVGDLPCTASISLEPESVPWCTLASQANVCVLAADGPVILAPILAAAAMGTPIVATATPQIQSAQPLAGLTATAPPNNPRLLAAAIVDVLRNHQQQRAELIHMASDDLDRRREQLRGLVRILLA